MKAQPNIKRDWFAEFRRRRMFRAMAAYLVGAWLLLQIASVTFPPLGLPEWMQRALIIALAVGVVPAFALAWIYDLTADHMRTWAQGTADGDWASMGIPSDGSYGIKPGVIYGYPVTCKNGKFSIVQGLEVNVFSRERMDATDKELREERAGVEHLFAKR